METTLAGFRNWFQVAGGVLDGALENGVNIRRRLTWHGFGEARLRSSSRPINSDLNLTGREIGLRIKVGYQTALLNTVGVFQTLMIRRAK
jgi:hypothetical protein